MSNSLHRGSIFLGRQLTTNSGSYAPHISVSPGSDLVASTLPGSPHPWQVNDAVVAGVTDNPTTLTSLGAGEGDVISAQIDGRSARATVPAITTGSPSPDEPIVIEINAAFEPAEPVEGGDVRLVAPETPTGTTEVSLTNLTLDGVEILSLAVEVHGSLVLPNAAAGILQAEWKISDEGGYITTTIETVVGTAERDAKPDAEPQPPRETIPGTEEPDTKAPDAGTPGKGQPETADPVPSGPELVDGAAFDPAEPKVGQTVTLLQPTFTGADTVARLKTVTVGGRDVTEDVKTAPSGAATLTVAAPGDLVAAWTATGAGGELSTQVDVKVVSAPSDDLAEATVLQRTVDDVAPAGVILEVMDIPADVYATGGFVWEFSDGGDYGALRDGHPWKIDGKRWCLTPKAVRVFETPGVVDWTLDIHYKGQHRRITGSFTVRDPAEAYPDANRFHVSAEGSFPDGAANTFETFDAAQNAAIKRSNDTDGPVAILLHAGEEFIGGGIEGRWGYDNGVWVSRYGKGENPILTPAKSQNEILFVRSLSRAKVDGLSFRAGWDQETETSSLGKNYHGLNFDNYRRDEFRSDVLVHNCKFHGCTTALNFLVFVTAENGKAIDFDWCCGVVVVSEVQGLEADEKGWSSLDYNFFGGAEHIGFCGCRSNQHPLALGGGCNKDFKHNQHAIFRLVSAKTATMWAFDGTSKIGWSKFGSNRDGGLLKDVPAHQPVIRWGASGWLLGAESCIGGAVMEGGAGLHAGTSSANGVSRPGRHTFNNNLVVASANSMVGIHTRYGGSSIHTNIVIAPDVRPEYYSGYQNHLAISGPGGDDEFGSKDFYCWAFNNSLINLGSKPVNRERIAAGSGGLKEIIVANNLVFAPKETSGPLIDHGPLDAASIILKPQYKGHRWENSPELDTRYATPENTVSLFRPLDGAGAIGAADPSQPVSELDFFGKLRGASKNIGAL